MATSVLHTEKGRPAISDELNDIKGIRGEQSRRGERIGGKRESQME